MGKFFDGPNVYTFSQVDAFTDVPFKGNPAAVMEMPNGFLPDLQLQQIAAENNLSETSFWQLRPDQPGAPSELAIDLRWFTPTIEVELCGHATLACAHAIMEEKEGVSKLRCHTLSGVLSVTCLTDGKLQMEFPAHRLHSRPDLIEAVSAGVGQVPTEVFWAEDKRDALAIFASPSKSSTSLLKCPKYAMLLPGGAPHSGPAYDFVYRFFAPRCGIDEDATTGSAQCSLVPVWTAKLNKTDLFSKQVSARGGELWTSLHKGADGAEDRTLVSGRAVTVIRGEIRVPQAASSA